jgi:hypothetical protein
LGLIQARVGRVAPHDLDVDRIGDPFIRSWLEKLAHVKGLAASLLSEMSFATIASEDGVRTNFTILRDTGHTNVAHLFRENARRVPSEDELTVVAGFLGAYPNALFEIPRKDLQEFVESVAKLENEAVYVALRKRFGVLRSSEDFWRYSDQITADHHKRAGLAAGLFDYNRLEGR